VIEYSHLRTGRLCLDAVTQDDLDRVHELHADPEVWQHLPSGRHDTLGYTAAYVAQIEDDWAADRLATGLSAPAQTSPTGRAAAP
jgi:RimJ/RimL family protein N-acetyltransferase